MKNNNKGVTLIELIVAFAIVSVATIYFFQTVSLVKRMYANAREETNNYADKTYVIRIMDACIDENNKTPASKMKGKCQNIGDAGSITSMENISGENNLYKVTVKTSKNSEYKFSRYYTMQSSETSNFRYDDFNSTQSYFSSYKVLHDENPSRTFWYEESSGNKIPMPDENTYIYGVSDGKNYTNRYVFKNPIDNFALINYRVATDCAHNPNLLNYGNDDTANGVNRWSFTIRFYDANNNLIEGTGKCTNVKLRDCSGGVCKGNVWSDIKDCKSNGYLNGGHIEFFINHGSVNEKDEPGCTAMVAVSKISDINN